MAHRRVVCSSAQQQVKSPKKAKAIKSCWSGGVATGEVKTVRSPVPVAVAVPAATQQSATPQKPSVIHAIMQKMTAAAKFPQSEATAVTNKTAVASPAVPAKIGTSPTATPTVIKSTWFSSSPKSGQEFSDVPLSKLISTAMQKPPQQLQQPQFQQQQVAKGPNFFATPILGVHGDKVANFAGHMGNIVASSMAAGFGATLGSRAAHSAWNGITCHRNKSKH